MSQDAFPPPQPGFPIGVVCRMTGIAPETLRAWERRYALVKPARAGGRNRLYSPDDIKRITLVKALVDAGHPVGSVASLGDAQLEALRKASHVAPRETAPPVARRASRIGLVGRGLASRLFESGAWTSALESAFVVGAVADIDAKENTADVLVIDLPTVHEDTVDLVADALSRASARAAVVVYEFGARGAISSLEASGALCLKGPVSAVDVDRACADALATAATRPGAGRPSLAPPRRFDAEQLARVVARAPVIACECPRHLADLIGSLAAFERYSGECESRSPADAHIHRDLQQTAGVARSMIEDSLARLLAFVGIDLDEGFKT